MTQLEGIDQLEGGSSRGRCDDCTTRDLKCTTRDFKLRTIFARSFRDLSTVTGTGMAAEPLAVIERCF